MSRYCVRYFAALCEKPDRVVWRALTLRCEGDALTVVKHGVADAGRHVDDVAGRAPLHA